MSSRWSANNVGRRWSLPPILVASMILTATAATLPPGFEETIVFNGLTEPTVVEFASDGRAFVAEKSGLIKVFESLTDTTSTVFADLRTNVHNFWDRGLLGMALDPNFPGKPYVYVLYTYDAAIGGTAPRWGTSGTTSDPCPNPPGATADGCVVSARLSRIEAAGNMMIGNEQVLIEDWCQQYPTHSIGALAFGPDGALYISAGDGANPFFVDYGQDGNPLNPCGDPPVGVGGVQTPPTAEGGSLRSQSFRRPGSEPVVLGGTILRVDPNTGAALSDNPQFSDPDSNARRIIAYGLRNPFRFALRPGTNEIWVGDVGWTLWEEINRIIDPTETVKNFGWPCYEGNGSQDGYNAANLNLCESLYNQSNATIAPFFTYNHNDKVVSGEGCPMGSSSISGMAFYNGGGYPAEYNGALFFADYSRQCIWAMVNVPPSPGTALVAAYSFNEGSGSLVGDASGNNFTGTIAGATWTTAGKYGRALSFDGTNDWVTIADTDLLDLSTGMTLMAWVYPTAHGSGVWRNVLIKERSSGEVYNLYSNTDTNAPTVYVALSATPNDPKDVRGTAQLPLNTWTHLATTYDGSVLRLFVNGNLVASRSLPGELLTSTGALRIGGNSLWGEYFAGRIDEVRIFDRALTANEIQTDMNTPIPTVSPTTIATFAEGAAGPVELKIGPGGDMFYVDLDGGTIRRIHYGVNQSPTAVATASSLSGPVPLTVAFDGTGSSDPDPGDIITSYVWDLDGDGQFDDSTAPKPSFTYTVSGSYTVKLKVTDSSGASGISAPLVITVGTPPTATINSPLATTTWRVGDLITFSGQATDQEDGPLPASAFGWQLILHHCPSNCHTHPLGTFAGVASGSFSAPDHDYPVHLELKLTVTDSSGLQDTKSVLLYPETVDLNFQSNPSGLELVVGSSGEPTLFSRTVILGSNNSLSAPSPQVLAGTTYEFLSWSDGGEQTHNIIATDAFTYTATYEATGTAGLVAAYGFNEGSGSLVGDASGNNLTGTISGATRTNSGKYGRALAFDGTNDWVTVPDSNLLDLTTGMTLMAWVYPTAHGNGVWRNVLIKERSGGEVYNLYSNSDTNRPTVYVVLSATPTDPNDVRGTAQLPLNTWTHLATTYDGSVLRLFVNGNLVSSRSLPGVLLTSTGALRIGGNSLWGEFFRGRIDEVRIYNSALATSEIQTDMNTPVP